MDRNEARRVLEAHNRWRRGDESVPETDPKALGVAIEVAVWALGEAQPLRDWFAGQVQADDRLVKCVRAMDDTALAIFALHPTAEREEHITETGRLDLVPDWEALDEVGKVTARLQLEAKAIARVRYMQADAMLAAREGKA